MRPAPRLVLAVAAGAFALALAIGLRVDRWFGLGDTVVRAEVTVAADAEAEPAALLAAWRARLPDARVRATPAADGRSWTVEVRGLAVDPAAVLGALDRPGVLAFHWVVSDTDLAKSWLRALGDGGRADGVRAETDAWGDHRGQTVYDYYLRGPSAEAIVAAMNEVGVDPPGDGLDLAFEWVEPAVDPPGAGFVRTYLIQREPFLTGADVAATAAFTDDVTGRPLVEVRFTPDGTARLAEQTARRRGHKLAILVDGWVSSAPVVQSELTRGRATITLGGATHAAQAAEARELVAALTGGAQLPRGLTARLVELAPAGRRPWLAWGGLALAVAVAVAFAGARLLGGLLVGAPLVAGARARAPRALGALAVAVAVTAAVIAGLWWLGDEVLLAGVSPTIIEFGDDLGVEPRAVGVFSLGLGPYLAAVFLIELAALAIPRWRQRRLGGPSERGGLDRAIVVATVVLAAIQAHFVWRFLDGTTVLGAEVVTPGLIGHLAVVASGVGGVLVLLVAARAITRWGLAHGVVVLVAVDAARLAWTNAPRGTDDPRLALAAAACGVALALVVVTTRRLTRGPRLPSHGLVPVAVMPMMVGLLSLLALLAGALDVPGRLGERSPLVDVAVVAAVLAGLAWRRPDLPGQAHAASAAPVVALAVVPVVLTGPGVLPTLVSLAPLGVIAVELAIGAWVRLRLVEPVAVAIVHGVDAADAACDRLADAGVPHAAVNVHLRAALRWLGAYAPISVVVAGADRARAEAALAAPPR